MSLAADLLFGLYVGLLTGIIPALVSGVLGFVFRYFTGVTLPGLGVVVLAVAIAGVNGGLLGLQDEQITQSPGLLIALVIVMMLALYAHSQGDKLGASLPRRFSLKQLRRQTLSADVVSVVGGIGQVTVTPAGEVDDLEGYPPLPEALRQELSTGSWDFPADVPLDELASRLEDRLRTEYDLADVTAAIDSRGQATISAAPPMGGLSRRVPDGHRAVSVSALVPTGVARGEQVWIEFDDERFEGTVVSARSSPDGGLPTGKSGVATDGGSRTGAPHSPSSLRSDGGESEEDAPVVQTAPTTSGGEGRITVAVPRSRAVALLRADRGRVVVRSRGTRREYELLSLFRRSGKQIQKLTVRPGGRLDGRSIGDAALRPRHGVEILAVRGDHLRAGRRNWTVSPSNGVELAAGDELFVVGRREAIQAIEGASA